MLRSDELFCGCVAFFRDCIYASASMECPIQLVLLKGEEVSGIRREIVAAFR